MDGVCVPESRYFKNKREEIILYLEEDAMWVTVERFGSQINLVLVSASFTRLPLKFLSALKCRVTLKTRRWLYFLMCWKLSRDPPNPS